MLNVINLHPVWHINCISIKLEKKINIKIPLKRRALQTQSGGYVEKTKVETNKIEKYLKNHQD